MQRMHSKPKDSIMILLNNARISLASALVAVRARYGVPAGEPVCSSERP